MAKNIGTQVKSILNDSAAKLEELKGKGKAVADKVKAKAEQVREQATTHAQASHAKLTGLVTEMSPKDFLDKFGGLKFPELVEKLKTTELAHQADAIRAEVLNWLRLPSTDNLDKLQVQIDKLAKEVAGLKGLKAEIKKLSDDVKGLKKPAKSARDA